MRAVLGAHLRIEVGHRSTEGEATRGLDRQFGLGPEHPRLGHVDQDVEHVEDRINDLPTDLLVGVIVVEHRAVELDLAVGHRQLETGFVGQDRFLRDRLIRHEGRARQGRVAARLVAARDVGVEQRIGIRFVIDAAAEREIVLGQRAFDAVTRNTLGIEHVAAVDPDRRERIARKPADDVEQRRHQAVAIALRTQFGSVTRIGVAAAKLDGQRVAQVVLAVGEEGIVADALQDFAAGGVDEDRARCRR